jgi:hypothetical protein
MQRRFFSLATGRTRPRAVAPKRAESLAVLIG